MGVRVYLAIAAVTACGRSGFEPNDSVVTGPPTNIAFVTSSRHVPGTIGGLAGADQICMARAGEAHLPGSYVAYISTTATDARDRLVGSRGWRRTDGRPFVDRIDDLVAGRISYPLRLDEHGFEVEGSNAVTGTSPGGQHHDDCGDYTDTSVSVTMGVPTSTTGSWCDASSFGCDLPARLYCFGLGLTEPVTVQPAQGRRAFVTVQTFAVGGGLAAADALCASEASLAGLGGGFRALLSISSASAASRFSLTGAPWIRMDGVPLADSPFALMNNQLRTSLSVTALGDPEATSVLTGGELLAPQTNNTCTDWTMTSTAGLLLTGRSESSDDNWFYDSGGATCNDLLSLYCFEE